MSWMADIVNMKRFFTDKSAIEIKKMSDYEAGKFVIKHFHDAAVFVKKLDNQSIYGLDKLMDNLEKGYGGKSQITGLGLGIKLLNIDETDIRTAMTALAQKTNGNFPKDIEVFRQAIIDHENYLADNFIETWKNYAEISQWAMKSAAKIVKEGTEAAIDTLENRKKILFWGAAIATIYGVYLLSTKAELFKDLFNASKASKK